MTEQTTDDTTTVRDRLEKLYGESLKNSYDELGGGALLDLKMGTYWFDNDVLDEDLDEFTPGVFRNPGRYDSEIDGIERFPREDRAREFLIALDDRMGYGSDVEYRPEVADETMAWDTDVPVSIAAEGKYYVAAWLAGHGFSNGQIASGLDVAESTIRVNLSKFKNGDL